MLKIVGGIVVYGFALFGLVKFVGSIRVKEAAPAETR